MNINTVFKYALETFDAKPEYLWAKDPDSAVLRRSDNNKWFAVIMRVTEDKLGLESGGAVDIIDVKCDPLMVGSMRMNDGVFPGYHMNKDHWITVLLDGSADDELVFSLLDMSYELAGKKQKRRK